MSNRSHITKRQVLLDLITPWSVLEEVENVSFAYLDDPGGNDPLISNGTFCDFAKEDWEDLGRPVVITVTIQPGDLLNVEGEVA